MTEVGGDRILPILQADLEERSGEYIHWDKLRRLAEPDGLNHREWWLGLKMNRQQLYRDLPLLDAEGENFVYAVPDIVFEGLHHVEPALQRRDRDGGHRHRR